MSVATAAGTANLAGPDAYVWALEPVARRLAAACSDDAVRLVDAATLQPVAGRAVHPGLTGLRADADVVVTAGRDGRLRGWDLRVGPTAVAAMDVPSAPFLSLAVGTTAGIVAVGTELTHAEATVQIWDRRAWSKPLACYAECHSDDVTDLCFHPTEPTTLLSGSTDGLVNVYDTAVADEDDALLQVINHTASIHRTGFLAGGDDIYALSHDERFAVHRRTDADDEADEVEGTGVGFGDLRDALRCEYVVDVLSTQDPGEGAVVVAGVHRTADPRLALVPLTPDPWSFRLSHAIALPNAHQAAVVRCVHLDGQAIYTGGEDGTVRAWRAPAAETGMTADADTEMQLGADAATGEGVEGRPRKQAKRNKGKEGHFSPY